MKLVGSRMAEGSGIGRLDGESKLVPLGSVEQFWVNPARAISRSAEKGLDLAELSLVPPVPAAARVLCVGLNYPAHVAEGTFQRPTHPSVFGRWTRSLTVSGTPAPVPSGEQRLDWQGELVDVVVTGTPNGVGYTRRPPRLLQPGDEVTVEIERVGSIRTPIVGALMRSA